MIIKNKLNNKTGATPKKNREGALKVVGIVAGCAAVVGLLGCAIMLAQGNVNNETANNSAVTSTTGTAAKSNTSSETTSLAGSSITTAGAYELTGEYECLTVDTTGDVELDLNSVSIKCSSGPAIYVKNAGSVSIVLSGNNSLSATTTEELNGVLHSADNLVISGDGSLTILGNYDGIVSKDTLIINGGTYTINVGDDAVRGNDKVEINGGNLNLTACEGIEGTYIKINDGTIYISASDDGINAASKSDAYAVAIELNGGYITIKMGAGDTDAVDSNGDIYMNGGTLDITAQSPFDYDGTAKYTGGTIIVNGKTTNAITNQFMGGGNMGGASRNAWGAGAR